ncbi:MAG TPA: hypothetical protein DCO75_04770 [Fibrobacteres bacterium]|nr:hypothetical protein [Fibrobacterota bacterium]
MKYRSIQRKLNVLFVSVISCAMISFFALGVFLGIITSYQHYLGEKKRISTSLLDKGMTLAINNSMALRGMAEDNSYSAIREVVASTVKNDSNMLYGIYMDNGSQPWVFSTRENPDGTVQGKNKLDDTVCSWAQKLTKSSYKQINIYNNFPSLIEFAAPVIGQTNYKLGVIRYGISTIKMKKSILEERTHALREGALFLVAFFLTALIFFIFALKLVHRQTKAITGPIEKLTKAAGTIAEGNYSTTIPVSANDEIGTLAKNFETMRCMVKEYTERLENKVAERTSQLNAAQKELIDKAHKAGMADIASGTLHNVGNILNSIKASVEAISDILLSNPLEGINKANMLLRKNSDNMDDFILNDKRCKKLLNYYLKIEDPLKNSIDGIDSNILRVVEKINAISDVISAQQAYAGIGGLSEKVNLMDIVDDSLILQSASTQRHNISIIKDYKDIPPVIVQKTKLVHILINLIKNAKDAMEGLPSDKKKLTISIYMKDLYAFIRISDTGCGISPVNIAKIFSHGFTTKKTGHGFGLHSSANYMKEMGGEMWAESDGENKGSSFIIKFPVITETKKTNHDDK